MLLTAKKIKDIGAHALPVELYELSIPFQMAEKSSKYVVGVKNYITNYPDDKVSFYTCYISDENGELLDYRPIMNYEETTPEQAFANEGITLIDG